MNPIVTRRMRVDNLLDIHVRCKECQSVYAIKRIVDALEKPIAYCIYCGGETVNGDSDLDYWESLALDVGLPRESANIVQMMFATWNPQDGDPTRFIDFARESVSAAMREVPE